MKIRDYKRHVLYSSIALLLLVPVIGLLLWGGFFHPINPQPSPTAAHTIDPLFKEFYKTLGGQEILGRVLTGLFQRDSRRCQYTENALLCFDAAAGDTSHRFFLAPLGRDLDVVENASLSPSTEGGRDLGGGFVLFDDFAPLYDRLYGALYTGKPLTQVRVNQAAGRYEQFFENVGFYRRFDDPPAQVHLLPYGAYLCGPDCSSRLDEYWLIQQSGMIAQPFEMSIQRLGWSVFGLPLTQPERTADGMIEQVYDNAMLYAPAGDLSQVRLRPLVRMLDFVQPEPLAVRRPHEQLVFYEVKDGLGHNVPLFFDRFIATHGGPDLAGDPLTEMFVLEPGRLFRQCFENYCLDYDALAPAQARVSMVPLGVEYVQRSQPAQILRRAFSNETVLLTVEESAPQLRRGEDQKVVMRVYQRQSGKPMYLVEGILTLTFPNRPSQTLYFRPTDQEGRSQLVFQVPDDLPNLSVVEYRVCLNLPADPRICATESFIYRGK